MKHDQLRSIAHNIADSLASGVGLLIGVYVTDIFEEAALSEEKHITVDFLKGTTSGGRPSDSLAKAIQDYSAALPDLCQRSGGSASDFQSLTARYSRNSVNMSVTVVIKDKNSRQSSDEYTGLPLKHIKTLDALERVRTDR